MKFNININQYELSKNKEITIQDSAVIDWLFTICGSDNERITKKRIEGWTWVSLQHLIDDMPLLRIQTSSGASKLIKRIKTLGFIDTKKDTKERKLYVKPTAKLRDLYFSKPVKSHVQKEASRVVQESSQVPEDSYHNTNINTLEHTKDIPTKVGVSVSEKFKPPYKYELALEKLGVSSKVTDKIIHNFFVKKKFHFENQEQFNTAYRRNLKPASQLKGYTSAQINKTMEFCETKYSEFNWGLETVVKSIATLVNKK